MNSSVVMITFVAVLAASFGVCAFLVLTQRWHGALSLDHDLEGVQKIHHNPVPRVGGVGVLAGLLMGVAVGYTQGGSTWPWAVKLLICSAPAFGAGLLEDLTKRVSVRIRLLASFASAALAVWMLDATLLELDTPLLDDAMAWGPVAVLFTCFAVGGLTNAVNIIDGLNGLASGAVALMLAGLAAIAWQLGDVVVMKLCLWGIAALTGFMMLNYPFGKIFLGDGGAYLAGFWLAECAVMLLHRNPELSTWTVLLVVAHPTCETLYSVYRRKFKSNTKSGEPDSVHFHHLVLRHISDQFEQPGWRQHGRATAAIWTAVAACQVVAYFTGSNTPIAATMVGLFVAAYALIYEAITHEENDQTGTTIIKAQ